jgi:hypothetical protein
MIPYEWNWLVVNMAWLGLVGYLVYLCVRTFRQARRRRDERKMREILLGKKEINERRG